MAYYIIPYYNYLDNLYFIAWIILGILILSLQLTRCVPAGAILAPQTCAPLAGAIEARPGEGSKALI